LQTEEEAEGSESYESEVGKALVATNELAAASIAKIDQFKKYYIN
jgi:hypothetical protein